MAKYELHYLDTDHQAATGALVMACGLIANGMTDLHWSEQLGEVSCQRCLAIATHQPAGVEVEAGTFENPHERILAALGPQVPPRLYADSLGFIWRDGVPGYLSMARVNPDNSPIPWPMVEYLPSKLLQAAEELPDYKTHERLEFEAKWAAITPELIPSLAKILWMHGSPELAEQMLADAKTAGLIE